MKKASFNHHVPLPWHTGGKVDYLLTSIWGPIPKGKASGSWIAKDIIIDDALFIVEAVNAYYKLQNELQEAEDIIVGLTAFVPDLRRMTKIKRWLKVRKVTI